MATDGLVGFYVETRNYGATAAFWASLGYRSAFETGHGSGQWEHPAGGPYVFIAEQQGEPLETHPILWVRDPDGRSVSLQGPLPEGVTAPDADAHHEAKYR